MNIAEILVLPDRSKVPAFTARVKFVNPRKSPKAPQKLKLEDDSGVASLALWSRPDVYEDAKGKQMQVAGASIQDNVYEGKTYRELHLHKEGSFSEAGGSGSPAPEQPTRTVAEFKKNVATAVNGHSHGSNGNGNGAKSGMCIKGALDVLITAYKKGELDLEFFGGPEFGVSLRRIASDIYRESEAIEAHKLTPSAKERAELVAGEDKVIEVAKELFTGDPVDEQDAF